MRFTWEQWKQILKATALNREDIVSWINKEWEYLTKNTIVHGLVKANLIDPKGSPTEWGIGYCWRQCGSEVGEIEYSHVNQWLKYL